jgi:hypothetical protein
VAALAAGLAGCTLITDSFVTNDFSGDPYPVDVDTSTGAIVVGMRAPGVDDSVAVLDLLSPITVTDPGIAPGTIPSLSMVDITLLGQAGPDGPIDRPRARFLESQLISLHPCSCNAADPACDPTRCHVGEPGGALLAFGSIFGADTLAGDAIRLRLGDDEIFVLPDIGGDDHGRTLSCDTVFDTPYRGGGTLVIDGTELPFSNLRPVMQACLSPDPAASPESARGTDVLLAISTSIGTSILSEAAYVRYQAAHADKAMLLGDLPQGIVYLPSGPVSGHLATLDSVALVGGSAANSLAPCRQIYAHQFLSQKRCAQDDPRDLLDCPCEDQSEFCPVPANLTLTPPAGLDVLVVLDTDATLQALRTELRPDQQELDGILGTHALTTAEIDVDYPHDRLLARCAGAGCLARPQLLEEDDRCQVNRCIDAHATADQTTLPGCLNHPVN